MKEYYSHDWDLVIGNLYGEKPYAILNMIELEAMAHRLPIIAIDHYEILKYPLSDISIIAKKLITDKGYKQEYVERNLAYIYESHSPQSVAQIYSSNLKKSSLFSQV